MVNIENILKTFNPQFNGRMCDYQGVLYLNIFDSLPEIYRVYYSKDTNDELICVPSYEPFKSAQDVESKIDDRYLLKKMIEISKNNNNVTIYQYSPFESLIIYDDETNKFMLNLCSSDNDDSSEYYLYLLTNNKEFAFDFIKEYCIKYEGKISTEFGITAVDPTGGLYTSWYEYSEHTIDINKNYNDDIPYEKICKLLESTDKPELLLFYGEPGTGKTSLIKHFITKYKDKDFVFMDGTLLANIGQEKLMSYFLENQNTIFILEDCEKVLMNREHYANPVMPLLLNLTDGIIGEVLGIKLICTFNTSLSNIDKALIRKGRLSLKYEFKKLSKDKVSKILNKDITNDMSLADIYYEDENDFSKKNTKIVGFG